MTKVLILVGTLLSLFLVYWRFSPKYEFQAWARLALLFAGFSGIAYGILGVVTFRIGTANRWYPLVSHTGSICAGIVIGLCLVLALTRECSEVRRRAKS